MKQIEIQYFFPLTEQIELDLDFSVSEEYNTEKRTEYWKNIWTDYNINNMFPPHPSIPDANLLNYEVLR